MQEASEEYCGYAITVEPCKDQNELWDFAYRLARLEQGGKAGQLVGERSKTAGGYPTPDVACAAGIQVARTEVDNLLALETRAS